MRGDQLARQWRTIRAIEDSPKALIVTEIAQREETGIRTIYRDLEALQVAGLHLYTEKVERPTGGFLSTPSNLKSLRPVRAHFPPFLSVQILRINPKSTLSFDIQSSGEGYLPYGGYTLFLNGGKQNSEWKPFVVVYYTLENIFLSEYRN